METKIANHISGKRFIPRIDKNSATQPNIKTGKGLEQTFLQRNHINGQLAHENMRNITKSLGKRNSKHSERPPHPRQDGYAPKQKATSVEKWEPRALPMAMQSPTAPVEDGSEVPQKTKSSTGTASSNSTPGYLSRRMESRAHTSIWTLTSRAALFEIAKRWTQPKRPLTDDG